MFIVFKMKHRTGPRSIWRRIATSPYYNIETIVSMEHEISFTIVYMEHKIFFMIASALLLIRIAWLGITETEYEKNDNKNHLRIF